MNGRKMDPSPSRTKGSLSFSSGAMDSKSLAKNSSGSLAAVRGLRCVARVDGASTARRWRLGSARTRDGDRASGRGPALLVRVLLEDLAPHVRARDWSRRGREGVDGDLRRDGL